MLGLHLEFLAIHALEGHDHIFQRGVAGTFADTGNGNMGHAGSSSQCRQGVGSAQAKVHVHVGLDRLFEAGFDLLDNRDDRLRMHAAEGIGTDKRIHVPVGLNFIYRIQQAIDFRTSSINGEKGSVKAQFLGGDRRFDGGFLGPFQGLSIGLFHENRIAGDFQNHSFAAGLVGFFDIPYHAAAEGENFRSQVGIYDGLHGVLIFLRNGRHARLNAVHAQLGQLLGDGQLVVLVIHDPRLLLAFTKGDIVNFNLGRKIKIFGNFRVIIPRAYIPQVCFM
ncbi:MAG: hypothetical protein BWY71_01208 [Planctomycetes bacterium ADurb.Bin412]|nr:MAG: hypothetical protein BWY71_01208 [Planctomycetes bacterium ADurb.Bin412]